MMKKVIYGGADLSDRIRPEKNGCWIWTGSVIGSGTPIIRRNHEQINVRRLVFEETAELELTDQEAQLMRMRCKNRKCIKPEHVTFIGKDSEVLNALLER